MVVCCCSTNRHSVHVILPSALFTDVMEVTAEEADVDEEVDEAVDEEATASLA